MVTWTGGRLLEPSPSTTFGGTSIPAAVLPADRSLVRNLIAVEYEPASLARPHSLFSDCLPSERRSPPPPTGFPGRPEGPCDPRHCRSAPGLRPNRRKPLR